MLKISSHRISVVEVPDEISLAFSISGCQIKCPNCHSPELWVEHGEELTVETVTNILEKYKPVSCILFMGGEHDLKALESLLSDIKQLGMSYKLAWYTGLEMLAEAPIDGILQMLDYVKFGPYIEELGGLESPSTNQQMLKYNKEHDAWEDITYKFQRLSK